MNKRHRSKKKEFLLSGFANKDRSELLLKIESLGGIYHETDVSCMFNTSMHFKTRMFLIFLFLFSFLIRPTLSLPSHSQVYEIFYWGGGKKKKRAFNASISYKRKTLLILILLTFREMFCKIPPKTDFRWGFLWKGLQLNSRCNNLRSS